MAKKNRYERHPIDHKEKLLQEKRTLKSSKKDKSSPNTKGCPGNDNNEHVYSHVLEILAYTSGRPGFEYHVWGPCIGCDKRPGRSKKKPTGEPDVVKRFLIEKRIFDRHLV